MLNITELLTLVSIKSIQSKNKEKRQKTFINEKR